MRTVCSGVPPTGFSQNTCFPAAAAATAISSWIMFGPQMVTTSTSGAATSSRQSPTARSNPKEPVAMSRRAGSLSAHTASTGS